MGEECASLQQQRAALEAEADELKASGRGLTQDLGEAHEARARLEAHSREQDQKIQQLQSNVSKLEKTVNKRTQKNKQLVSQLEQCESNLKKAQEHCAELETAHKDELAKVANDLAQAQSENGHLT